MQIRKQFSLREVAGEYLLIPMGESAIDLNGMITTNEVGATIWELLPQVCDEKELIERLLQDYEVERTELEADVRNFLQSLRHMGIV